MSGPGGSPRRLAGYARFSPDDRSKISIEMQDSAFRRLCEHRSWTFIRTYKDDNLSGAVPPEDRPGLTELLDDARRRDRAFDSVVYYEDARLAREPEIYWRIVNKLKEMGVVCLTYMLPDIDSSMPDFKLTSGIGSAVASHYRDLVQLKTRDALSELKSRGFAVSKAPLGFCLVEGEGGHKRVVPDDFGLYAYQILTANPKIKLRVFADYLGLKDTNQAYRLRAALLRYLGPLN